MAGLDLLDRGYRTAKLFNQTAGGESDYVSTISRNEGRSLCESAPLPKEARAIGVVADQRITYGGAREAVTKTVS